MNYIIKRPPFLDSFEMPSRRELSSLKIGDNVKLIFTDKDNENGERMWVKLTKNESGEKWEGELDNKPLGLDMKCGEKIIFHPLDVIDCTNN